MKVTYIKLLNKKKKDESVLMKHLRDENSKKQEKKDFYSALINKLGKSEKKNPLKKLINNDVLSKKIVKKNQVVLVATSLMLVTAGYLNYTNNIKMAALGDAQLVSANVTESEENVNDKDTTNGEEEIIETSIIDEENSIQTSTQNEEQNEYFTKTKLERETMYSQMLETYQKILENNNIPNDQKSIASNEIKNINDKKSAISTIENLIKIKGFEDLAILINGNSVNVVVKSTTNLEPNQVAQIQNIVSRELQTNIEDIHITTHE